MGIITVILGIVVIVAAVVIWKLLYLIHTHKLVIQFSTSNPDWWKQVLTCYSQNSESFIVNNGSIQLEEKDMVNRVFFLRKICRLGIITRDELVIIVKQLGFDDENEIAEAIKSIEGKVGILDKISNELAIRFNITHNVTYRKGTNTYFVSPTT